MEFGTSGVQLDFSKVLRAGEGVPGSEPGTESPRDSRKTAGSRRKTAPAAYDAEVLRRSREETWNTRTNSSAR